MVVLEFCDSEKGTCETTLNGHKGVVTALRYNDVGSLLASGSKDNDVILWEVVVETGLFAFEAIVTRSPPLFSWILVRSLLVHLERINFWEFGILKPSIVCNVLKDVFSMKAISSTEARRKAQDVMKRKTVEVFRVLDNAEAKRKLHRKKEKKAAKGTVEETEKKDTSHGTEEDGNNPVVTVPDVFKFLQTIRAGKKICSISFCPTTPKNSLASVALSLKNLESNYWFLPVYY
ncbi:hypothetical protein Dsin_007190 [Dipteronia sinensis]|uniref:Uncharacterized protein n=1 Tax=Dipteronia sinensis TaxID=43782 RepID=A0AAE0B0N5_9ROSI|nr:hypothetical protein Dsin_007190 [Dipteronia sinensis]